MAVGWLQAWQRPPLTHGPGQRGRAQEPSAADMVIFSKSEFRMTKSERSPKPETRCTVLHGAQGRDFRFRYLSFIRHSSFVIRHWSWFALLILLNPSLHAQAPA